MATKHDDPIQRLVVLADANMALAEEIRLLLDQTIAENALATAANKTRTLIENAAEARRLVQEFQRHSGATNPSSSLPLQTSEEE